MLKTTFSAIADSNGKIVLQNAAPAPSATWSEMIEGPEGWSGPGPSKARSAQRSEKLSNSEWML
jgi:hypothetical protein